jgi:hypothetical protein
LPEPAKPRQATVKMTKTQPLLTTPQTNVPSPPVSVAQTPAVAAASSSWRDMFDLLDEVPLPVCWTIFGVSAVTLLIQIWNYLSS